MCGRYVNKLGEVQYSFFEVSDIRIPFRPRFNIAPSTEIPVVKAEDDSHRVLVAMKWGLRPFWAKPDAKLPSMINARAESIASKPAYRAAFKSRRCLVPASGYYEWSKMPEGGKQPFYFERKDGHPIAFAAIYEPAHDDFPETVAIVTTEPNEEALKVHDRMPVILRRVEWPRWFDPSPLSDEERERMLVPAPDGSLNVFPVDKAVGNVRNDNPGLTAPVPFDVP